MIDMFKSVQSLFFNLIIKKWQKNLNSTWKPAT